MTYIKLEDAVKAVRSVPAGTPCRGLAIEKTLLAIPTDDGWEDIATAPRQVWLLCWGPDAGCGVAKYPFNIIGDEWPDYTHWRPLPAPPAC